MKNETANKQLSELIGLDYVFDFTDENAFCSLLGATYTIENDVRYIISGRLDGCNWDKTSGIFERSAIMHLVKTIPNHPHERSILLGLKKWCEKYNEYKNKPAICSPPHY